MSGVIPFPSLEHMNLVLSENHACKHIQMYILYLYSTGVYLKNIILYMYLYTLVNYSRRHVGMAAAIRAPLVW